MLYDIGVIFVSLLALIKSADYLVDGASSLAKRLGVRSLVIGLTVVAFGTSAPELAVNISSAFAGATDIAVANVVGSNIANILLILGVVALMKGVHFSQSTVWREIPYMIFGAVLLFVLTLGISSLNISHGILSFLDGIILLGCFFLFLFHSYRLAKKSPQTSEPGKISLVRTLAMLVGGLAGLILAGKFLVASAVDIAQALGVTERVIGLTIIAIGTSLPELVTSIIAVRKGKPDLAVGNVIGSNIFNVFFVLGATSLFAPLSISSLAINDIFFMIACSFLVSLFLFVGKKHALDRWQGAVMLLLYVAYLGVLIT